MTTNNDPRSLSKARYSKFAAGYVTSETHAKGEELDRLLTLASPQPHWIALDVATGGGHTALKFAPFVARVIATDLTPEMLKKAESFVRGQGADNVEFRLADAESLPFEDGRFDLVTCRIAPHHFPDAARFVREGARVLMPEGLLLVQDHVLPEDDAAAAAVDEFERLRDPSHNRAFNEAEWRAMFEQAGLRVEHTEQIIKRHAFLPWAERQGCAPDVIEALHGRLRNALPAVAAWMLPRDIDTPQASFANRHLILAGRKAL